MKKQFETAVLDESLNCMVLRTKSGHTILFDVEDFELLSQYTWTATYNSKRTSYYACTTIKKADGKRTTMSMHRLLMDMRYDLTHQVDHKNHNGLDNRRCNLRKCTRSQNQWNRRKAKNNTTGFSGVWWDQKLNMFRGSVNCKGKRYFTSYCTTARKAAKLRDELAKKLHSEFFKPSLEVTVD